MILVDTSAWLMIALRHSHAADAAERSLREHAGELVTTDTVLTETWDGLQRRRHASVATRACLDIVDRTGVLTAAAADRDHAVSILRDWPDQPFSYCDALSFAVMEANGIDRALTFDQHFSVYRYGPGRARSFDVLP